MAGRTARISLQELDRAGAIDEGVGVAHEVDRGDVQLHAHAMGARLGAGIADRGARGDATLTLQRAHARQDGFQQRRLAALERAHERDAPWTPATSTVVCFLGHDRPPPCRCDELFRSTIHHRRFLLPAALRETVEWSRRTPSVARKMRGAVAERKTPGGPCRPALRREVRGL